MNTRTILLTLAVAMLSSAAYSQEKSTPAAMTSPKATPATDELMQQKRSISGELKNTLGLAEGLAKRAMGMASSANGAEQEQYMSTANAIKTIQSQLTDQLGLVNGATAENSKGVFAQATEVLATSAAALEVHKKALAPVAGDVAPTTK